MPVRLGQWCGLLLLAAAHWGCGLTRSSSEFSVEPDSGGAGGTGGVTQPSSAGAGGVAGPELVLPEAGTAGTAGGLEPPQPIEPHAARPCDNPQPFEHGGGYLVCEDHSLRRGEPADCTSVLPRAEPTGPIVFDECALDTDCIERAHGFCAYGACEYGCVSDDDCSPGGLCFCGEQIGKCVAAACTSDSDCPADYPCTGNHPFGTDEASFQCQSPLDECQSDYDCNQLNPRAYCRSDGERRHCAVNMVG